MERALAPSVGELLKEAAAGDVEQHHARMVRYADGKRGTYAMANYLGQREPRRAVKVFKCANLLHFRKYLVDQKCSLIEGFFCQQWKLCQTCAIRRGAKAVQVMAPKITDQLQADNRLRAYLVTLTTKDEGDCAERFEHLKGAQRKLYERRNDARKKERGYIEANKASGIYWAFEGGLGKNSGSWHWHSHAIWLCRNRPDARVLSAEWEAITGDSFIVDVREFNCTKNNHRDLASITKDVIEVCKYALKPHGMTPGLAWQTHQATGYWSDKTTGKWVGYHFSGSLGSLRLSAAESERIAAQYDQRPDEAQATMDLLYRFSERTGDYQELDDGSKITHLRLTEARRLNREMAMKDRAWQVSAARGRSQLDTGVILGDRYANAEQLEEPPDLPERGKRLMSEPNEVEDLFAVAEMVTG